MLLAASLLLLGSVDHFRPPVEAAMADEAADLAALRQTSEAIRAGFARGDVAEVMRYHHAEVRKALAHDRVLIGAQAVAADLAGSFAAVSIEFVGNDVESLIVQGDTAIEQTRFTVRVTPKSGGAPSIFRGRAQIVYVRSAKSPSGWASLRELVQPFP
jgi:ketosteroid isomerase-like protein